MCSLLLFGTSAFAEETPAFYDCRQEGKTPAVRSQGSNRTCWALSCVEALEGTLMPLTDISLSADHLVENNSFHITPEEGGDSKMIMAYLSGWQGPVLQDTSDADAAVHVQEMRILDGEDRAAFKDAITAFGPVQTSLYMNKAVTEGDEGYYNEETASYYCPDENKVDHDVIILGWDDTYSADNFILKPASDGAWICQNSWGEDFGDDGIFYVSYEDANIAAKGIVYSGIENRDNYDHIYQYDDCGWQGQQGYQSESCYFANCYVAQREEYISAAGFYSTGKNTTYQLYLVHNFEDETSFDERILLQEGELETAGYFTVPLMEKQKVEEGEAFALVVHITTPGADNPVAVELNKDRFTADVTTAGKEGYLSKTGVAWENTETKFQTNVCLKVYTEDESE